MTDPRCPRRPDWRTGFYRSDEIAEMVERERRRWEERAVREALRILDDPFAEGDRDLDDGSRDRDHRNRDRSDRSDEWDGWVGSEDDPFA